MILVVVINHRAGGADLPHPFIVNEKAVMQFVRKENGYTHAIQCLDFDDFRYKFPHIFDEFESYFNIHNAQARAEMVNEMREALRQRIFVVLELQLNEDIKRLNEKYGKR